MMKLKKRFQVEVILNPEQQNLFFRTRGVCRFVHNLFLARNQQWYEEGKPYLSAREFSVWLNNTYLSDHPEKLWIKEVSSKSVKQSLEYAHQAYKRFFKGLSFFPRFKKKGRNEPKVYFVKNNPKDCICERHRMKLPKFGWVRLKEKGYIPVTKDGYTVSSGTLDYQAGRFYLSVLVEVPDVIVNNNLTNDGIGIDLGIKQFAVCSNGTVYQNINKTAKVRKLEKQLKRAQQRLSRKYENKKKGGATQGRNIQKQKEKVQRLYHRIACIRDNRVKTVVSEIVKTKPSYITIEDLNVTGMMKNRHLSKAVSQQKFHDFRRILAYKCKEHGIELRIVDRWYPSSKICHCCGNVKKDLKLSDRVYTCTCGYREDRDVNASLNLKDARIYKIA